jgi:hypothetical protein
MKAMGSACLAVGLLLTAFMQAGPISVGDTRIENAYPDQIAFEIDVSSSAAISRVELHIALQGDVSTTVIVADFVLGNVTSARAV